MAMGNSEAWRPESSGLRKAAALASSKPGSEEWSGRLGLCHTLSDGHLTIHFYWSVDDGCRRAPPAHLAQHDQPIYAVGAAILCRTSGRLPSTQMAATTV